jgi:hypothetical protein
MRKVLRGIETEKKVEKAKTPAPPAPTAPGATAPIYRDNRAFSIWKA